MQKSAMHEAQRPRPRASVALAGAMLATLAAPLHAQPVVAASASNDVVSWYRLAGDPPTATERVSDVLCPPTSFDGSDIVGSCGVPGLSIVAHARGRLGGVLRAEAHLTAAGAHVPLGDPPPDAVLAGVRANAYADLRDEVTFGGVVPAVLRFSCRLDGTTRRSSAGGGDVLEARASVYVLVGPVLPTRCLGTDVAGTASGATSFARVGFVDVPVVGGGPVSFYYGLFASTLIGDAVGATLDGAVDADFAHTARLGVRALDADGRDVTAAARLTFAGAAYPVTVAAVPEPGALALVGAGLVVLSAGVRRRRRGADPGRPPLLERRGILCV